MTIFDVFEDNWPDDGGAGAGDAEAVPAAPATGMPVAFSGLAGVSVSRTQSMPPLICAWKVVSRQMSIVCPSEVYHIRPFMINDPCCTVVPFVVFMPLVPVPLPKSTGLSRYHAEPLTTSEGILPGS